MNTIDLQLHSTASDGKHSPREVIRMCQEQGLNMVSLTDHDTVSGLEEALAAVNEFGVGLIPGIEMSVEERGAHVLGYGIDYKNPELLAALEGAKQGRLEGARQMTENLKQAGFAVQWEDVLKEATGAVVARPHIARAILNRPGNAEKLDGISTVHEFIQNYLSDQSPNYVKRNCIGASGAIELIHKAGGMAVWSHPSISFQIDPDGLEKFLQELIGFRIDGVEVFNPSHTEDEVEFVQGLAVKYKLLRSAGSDFHEKGGGRVNDREPEGLKAASSPGDYPTYGFSTEDIVPRLEEAIELRKNI